MAEEDPAVTRWTIADVVAAKTRVMAGKTYGMHDPKIAAENRSKYGNKKTGSYVSKREAKRAEELKLLQEAGEIRDLEEQVSYVLIPKQPGERECSYVCDFRYTTSHGETVVEDVKGVKTPVWRIKRKLMLHVHGIRVRET